MTAIADIQTLDACRDNLMKVLKEINNEVSNLRREVDILRAERNDIAKGTYSLQRIREKLEDKL